MRNIVRTVGSIVILLLMTNSLRATSFVLELALFECITPLQNGKSTSDYILPLIISDSKSGLKITQQREHLKQIFNLSAIKFLVRGRIIWHPRDKSGEVIWENFNREEIIYPRLKAFVTVGGNEYLVFLTPSDFHMKLKPLGGNIKLNIEVYKGKEAKNNNNSHGLIFGEEKELKSIDDKELLQKTALEISVHTPIFLQFRCNGKVYFLSLYNSFILGSPIGKE